MREAVVGRARGLEVPQEPPAAGAGGRWGAGRPRRASAARTAAACSKRHSSSGRARRCRRHHSPLPLQAQAKGDAGAWNDELVVLHIARPKERERERWDAGSAVVANMQTALAPYKHEVFDLEVCNWTAGCWGWFDGRDSCSWASSRMPQQQRGSSSSDGCSSSSPSSASAAAAPAQKQKNKKQWQQR